MLSESLNLFHAIRKPIEPIKYEVMKVDVLFFGVLTDVSNVNKLVISDVKNIEGLRSELQNRYPDLGKYTFQISVNREIIRTNKTLRDGDEIALLPPFAGG